VEEIATRRMLAHSTIYGHLAVAMEAGEELALERFFIPEEQAQVAAAFAKVGLGNLTGAHEALGGRFDFGRLRVFRAAHGRSAASSLAQSIIMS
jgi:ATP-dependent DNA helicase RecQ